MPELQRLHPGHAPAVLAFELANRSYFASFISDRGDEFFDQFTEQHSALLAEQEAGAGAYYVLVAEDGSVLGRFNLYRFEDGTAWSRPIGRIARSVLAPAVRLPGRRPDQNRVGDSRRHQRRDPAAGDLLLHRVQYRDPGSSGMGDARQRERLRCQRRGQCPHRGPPGGRQRPGAVGPGRTLTVHSPARPVRAFPREPVGEDNGWTEWFLSWPQFVQGSALHEAVEAGPGGSTFVDPATLPASRATAPLQTAPANNVAAA